MNQKPVGMSSGQWIIVLGFRELGDAEFGIPRCKKSDPGVNNFLLRIPADVNFSGWTSFKFPKMSVLTSCAVATH